MVFRINTGNVFNMHVTHKVAGMSSAVRQNPVNENLARPVVADLVSSFQAVDDEGEGWRG
jgi:hypothetical protein